MLNPRHLLHFQAATRHGNLRRAAKELGISQPALTKSIRALEQGLGMELLTRSVRGVAATAVGKALAIHAEAIAAELIAAETTLDYLRGGSARSVRLGAGPTYSDWLLPRAVQLYRERFPDVRVWVMIGLKEELVHALRTGSIDFFLGSAFEEDPTGFQHEILYSDRLGVCCRPGHPLLELGEVLETERLASYEWAFIRGQKGGMAQEELMRIFLEDGLGPPRTLLESNSAAFVYATVAQTDALCLRPIPIGQGLRRIGGLVELSIPPVFPRMTRGLTYRDPAGLTVADRAMVRLLKEITAGFVEAVPALAPPG